MKKWLFNLMFRKLPILSWVDGHKTEISRYVTFISTIALLVAQFFPQYAGLITEGLAQLGVILGLVGIEIGKMDKEVKNG